MRQQQLKFGLEGKSQLHLGAMVREAWLRSRQPSPSEREAAIRRTVADVLNQYPPR